MIKSHSAFIENNPNLKCYPTLINKATLHSNAIPLVLTNNSEIKFWILKDITIGASELTDNEFYCINKITLTAQCNDMKTGTQPVKSTTSNSKDNNTQIAYNT